MTLKDGGWFTSFPMGETTARAVQADKDRKYMTELELVGVGKWIVKWRGLTAAEAEERKRQKKAAKGIG
jgi:hypothetical protein